MDSVVSIGQGLVRAILAECVAGSQARRPVNLPRFSVANGMQT
jgi:hypothetical protein